MFNLMNPDFIWFVSQRIEEIMKRTRKSEVEPPSGASGEC